jgi:hypothetical protein
MKPSLQVLIWLLILLAAAGAGDARAAARLTNAPPSGGKIVIGWTSRGTLETAPQLAGPWKAVTNASNPYTNSLSTNLQFFRLNQTVDTTTLHGKVLCGYQGWFRAGSEWDHWSRNWSVPPQTNALTNITFEMWPEMTEYTNQYAVPGFTYPGGAPASLYNAPDQQTIDTHFNWMQDYGIDGVVLQRFVVAINGSPAMTNVLARARAAANRTGRAFCLEYDMSGAANATLFNLLTNDWTWLCKTQHVTQDPRYLYHNGKPVLIVFGFYPDRFTNDAPALPAQIIAWFKTNTAAPVTLIGSGQWWWRTETAPGWTNIFRTFDGYLPWNAGNYFTTVTGGVTNYDAQTNYWAADLQVLTNAGMFYLPEIYPGFSWHNLNAGPFNQVPRQGGKFLWHQFTAVKSLGLDMAYLGMFDEVDEGTAIYKVSNTPPPQAPFLTYSADGTNLPSDWYLRLTAEGTKVLAGERPSTPAIPISP